MNLPARFHFIWMLAVCAVFVSCGPDTNLPDPCLDVPCSGHGICDEGDDGEPYCVCETGFSATEDGLGCVEGCTSSHCSGHGACVEGDDGLSCDCDPEYSGDRCTECAVGFVRDGGGSGSGSGSGGGTGDCIPACDPDPCSAGACHPEECVCEPDPCESDPCGGHGDCSCVAGEADCRCDAEYDGDFCDECAEGYAPRGDECVPCNDILFEYHAPDASSVWISGDWLGWPGDLAAGAIPMVNDGAGNWTASQVMDVSAYTYKFIVNSVDWIHDPRCDEASDCASVDDGMSGNNCACSVPCPDDPPPPLTDVDWQDVVMYFVMVDRFYDSDGVRDEVSGATDGPGNGPSGQYMGGDLAGVTEQMGYLSDLGVTTIWLSAPYDNRDTAGAAIDPGSDPAMYTGYHGYWPSPENTNYSDPTSPSPRPLIESRILATDNAEAELHELIDAAHDETSALGEEHGIRVLFDYVMNHVDVESELFAAHPDYFVCREHGAPRSCSADFREFALCGPEDLWQDETWGTRCAFTSYLAPFDFYNPAARAWSVADAIWWAQEFDVDGYRLDAIKHVPMEWLEELRSGLNDAFPEPWGNRFYLVGETYEYGNRDEIGRFVDPDTRLDGQFDFPMREQICASILRGSRGLNEFESWMRGNDGYYGDGAIMSTWVGNHDIPRAIHFADRDPHANFGNCYEGSNVGNGWSGMTYGQPSHPEPYERLGVAFAVILTNPGIPLIYYGDEVGLAGGGDPDNRRMMVFNDGDLNDHQRTLRDRVAQLSFIRAENRALSRGHRTTVHVDGDTWAYTMGGVRDTQDVTVIINRADSGRTVSIPAGSYTDLMNDAAHSGGSIDLSPRSFMVLRHE